MFVHTPRGCIHVPDDPSGSILRLITSYGGKPSEWYCDTTPDGAEALAHHKADRVGSWLWVECAGADDATFLKAELAARGLACPPDLRTRGGAILYCVRITFLNCHTVRSVTADWSYRLPRWLAGGRVKYAVPHTNPPTPKFLSFAQGGFAVVPATSREEKIEQARQKGYEEVACPECGQLTLLRAEACAKCDTCGATSGCS